jgi:hypothetical protein
MLVGFAFSFHLGSWIGGVSWQGVFAWSILQNLALAGLVAYFLSKTKIRYQLLTAAIIFYHNSLPADRDWGLWAGGEVWPILP